MSFPTEADVARRPYFVFVQHRAGISPGVFYTIHRHHDGHLEATQVYASADAKRADVLDEVSKRRVYDQILNSANQLLETKKYQCDDYTVVASSTAVGAHKAEVRGYLEALAGGHDIPIDDIQVVMTFHHPQLIGLNKTDLTFRQYFEA